MAFLTLIQRNEEVYRIVLETLAVIIFHASLVVVGKKMWVGKLRFCFLDNCKEESWGAG